MVLGGLLPNTPVVNVAVILVATGFIWFGSGWLEGSAEQLSAYYGLPAVVQGSIVVAVGSSFPELSSVTFTALAGSFDMGVGAIVGSAVFNVLVIPGLSGITTDDDLETSRAIVYKEAQFYMIAVSALVITFALAVILRPGSRRFDAHRPNHAPARDDSTPAVRALSLHSVAGRRGPRGRGRQ